MSSNFGYILNQQQPGYRFDRAYRSAFNHLETANVTWFQPPQLRIGDGIEDARHATWLELFFDLIFVVAVSQVAHNLSEDVSPSGFLGFVLLFLPIWWAWIGATLYANRFDVDDIGNRLLTAVQMLAVAAMAVNVHQGLDHNAPGFALSYVVVRAVLVFQYLRAAQHVPSAKPLATAYALGFAVAASLWLVSVFVPAPARFVLWGLGLTIDLATPLLSRRFQLRLMPHFEHLPERFGLFVIIVLGEAVIAVVSGVAQQKWELLSVLAAVAGFSIAFSLWWIYFENVGSTALRAAGASGQVGVLQLWLYGHLPLVLGMAGAGVAVEHGIKSATDLAFSDADRWLLCGSLALCLLSLALLHRTGIIFRCRVRARFRLGAAFILLLLGAIGGGLPTLAIVMIAALLCATQVVQDIYQGHPVPA